MSPTAGAIFGRKFEWQFKCCDESKVKTGSGPRSADAKKQQNTGTNRWSRRSGDEALTALVQPGLTTSATSLGRRI
jgi:hypothetical protein